MKVYVIVLIKQGIKIDVGIGNGSEPNLGSQPISEGSVSLMGLGIYETARVRVHIAW